MAIINGSFASNSKNLQPYIEYTYTQNTSAITTTVTAKLYVKKLTSYGNTWDSSTPYSLSIGGSVVSSGSKSVDMRNTAVGASVLVTSGSRTLSHTSSGTLSAAISGVVDWTGSNPGKGTVSSTITFPSISVNSAPYFDSGAYITIRENNSSGRAISAAANGTENASKYPENVANLYVSWPAVKDKETTSGITYVLMCQSNESSWWEQWRGNTTYYTHGIGAGNQNQSIDYYVYAIDNGGLKSGNVEATQVQKNKFTAATLSASGSIGHNTGNQTITIGKSGASNTYTGTGAAINYKLSAKIGSTAITVYNATASGNLTIVPGTGTVSNPHIRLGDIRNAVKSSSYNGTLTLTLTSSNNWGSSGSSSKDISVDLRTNPVAGANGVAIDSSSYYAVPNGATNVNCIVPARKKIKLTWSAASDPNGTPITYRVEQQIGTSSWTTLTSSTSNAYYEFNANVSGKPSYKWRVYAKNSYGREILLAGTPGATLYSYSAPTIGIKTTIRTATDFTINFATSISTELVGNAIQSITLNYGGKDTPIATNVTSAKLTGLTESSTGSFRLTIVDIHGATFGVTGGVSEGSIPQFYPVLSIRKNGVGVKAIPDGSADFMIGGRAKINEGFYIHSSSAGAGTAGYILIATLIVGGSYQNSPIEFKVAQRGKKSQPKLSLQFSNANTTTPGISEFTKDSSEVNAWIKDNANGSYDIYIQKSEGYDTVDIVDFKKGPRMNNVTVAWKNIFASALPSGAIAAYTVGGVSFDKIYPVGSIYLSTSSTNPSSHFGGTWVAWGAGRVPVGINTGDGDFNTVEKTGGSKSVSSSHTHSTANHTLTVTQIPAHNHSASSNSTGAHTHALQNQKAKWASNSTTNTYCFIDAASGYTAITNKTTTSAGAHSHTITVNNSGGGGAHNHGNTGSATVSANVLQPYITCYMWKRTA